MRIATARATGPRLATAPATTSATSTSSTTSARAPGLQPAHVQQVLHQRGEPVERALGRFQQLRLVLGAEPQVGRPQGADGRLGRGERRPQVVADRAEQGGADAVDLGQRARGGGRLLQPLVLDGAGRLRGERLEHPAGVGLERVAGEDEAVALVDVDLGVALARAYG